MSRPPAAIVDDPWGTRARDWAEIEDEGSRPLFEAVLDLLGVGEGTRFVDVGCGSGLACRIAADRGAVVSGIDASPGLAQVASERTTDADIRVGDMVSLPWTDESFDAVSFINTFFFAADQARALSEAARVSASGARVAVVGWTSPDRMQSAGFLGALGPLLPPLLPIDPFISPARLQELASLAGLRPTSIDELDWTWDYYPDLETAVRGLMSVGLSSLAIARSGEDAVRDAIVEFLRPFRTPAGGYNLVNSVYCLVAEK